MTRMQLVTLLVSQFDSGMVSPLINHGLLPGLYEYSPVVVESLCAQEVQSLAILEVVLLYICIYIFMIRRQIATDTVCVK